MVYAVRHVMSKPLITVDVEAIVKDAIKLMIERNIGALVVTEEGKPVGIITERDILRNCCLDASCMNFKVREIMSKSLVTVDGKTSIGQASEIMTEKKIRRLLVTEKDKITEEEKIVGIVTQRDLMRAILDAVHSLHSLSLSD